MAQELIFTQRFKKNYQALPSQIQRTFDKKLEIFVENPKHPSLNVHRYLGSDGVWEAYVTKGYRFTFSVEKNTIFFRNIGPHAIVDRGDV